MASATTTIHTQYDEGGYEEYPVYRATKIPAGALVMLNSSGYAVNGADTASCVFAGVAVEEADNTSGSDGTITVRCRIRGRHKFLLSSAAITDIGSKATLLYNNEVSRAATTTNDIYVGRITQIAGSTHAWVDIGDRD